MSRVEAAPYASPEELVRLGPIVQVHVGYDRQSTLKLALISQHQEQGVPALVDTGANESFLDLDFAEELNLPCVDEQAIAGSGGQAVVGIFSAQISVPDLGRVIWGEFSGAPLAQGGAPYKAILGREFLSRCVMIYDGPGNRVTLLI